MFFPLTFLIGPVARWLIGRKPSLTQAHADRQATALVWAALILAALGGGWLWLHFHDAAVIERHDDKQARNDLQTALDRTNTADTAGDARSAARAAAAEQSRTAMEEAEADDPQAAQAPAGAVTRAAAGRLPVRR